MKINMFAQKGNSTYTIIILISINSMYEVTGDKSSKRKLISIDQKYKSGVQAYANDRWSECVKQFEETIHLNKLYNAVTANCGQRCKELSYDPMVKEKIEDLIVYETYLRRTECLLDCRKNGLMDLHIDEDISSEVSDSLVALEPYNYIHLCYFRMNLMPKAASAAYTYLSAHPNDATMKHNYNYYINQPEVDDDDAVDLESDDYKFLYWQGAKAYEKKQWGETVATMEEVLDDYIASENKCRHSCEALNNQHWQHEFDNIASYFLSVLKCKQRCQNSVASLGFHSGVDFIADVLNHIQIGYYHLDLPKKAARAVQSFLLIFPDDKDMLENKNIYSILVTANAFIEKPEIVFYWKRYNYERKLLNYFHTKEGIDDAMENLH